MKKQYVKPVVTVVKMMESHAVMAGSVKLNGFIENDPETKNKGISILWGDTQENDTQEEENGFLWGD